jgi:hypothetical protein
MANAVIPSATDMITKIVSLPVFTHAPFFQIVAEFSEFGRGNPSRPTILAATRQRPVPSNAGPDARALRLR